MSPLEPPPGDRFRYTTLGHRDHGLCSPLAGAKLQRLLARLQLGRGDVALDLAGGKGLLARAVAELTGARALVVDANPWFLAEGRAALRDAAASPGLAADLEDLVHVRARSGAGGAVEFLEGDVADHAEDAVCFAPGGAALVACVGARPFGDRAATLGALVGLTRPGGQVLVGEGYWRDGPDAGLLELFGGHDAAEAGETFEGHPRLAEELGLSLVWAHGVTTAELTDYDRRFCGALAGWCGEHPDDPDAAAFAERVATWEGHMVRRGRAAMGFGWYLYRRP